MSDSVSHYFLKSGMVALLAVSAPALAQEEAAREEKPSAELIIDAEETIIKDPALEPGEEPLPTMDGSFPGEQNIFGDDLFGAPIGGGSGGAGRARRVRVNLVVAIAIAAENIMMREHYEPCTSLPTHLPR